MARRSKTPSFSCESKAYQAARVLPRRTKEERKARAVAFRDLDERFGLREYDLHAWAGQFGQSWLGQHLDVNTIQTLATRAVDAVRQHQFGKRGRPRFKGKGQLLSVEGKTNKQGIRWREGAVLWGALVLPARIPTDDPVVSHALASRIKYVRLVRRVLNGRPRFFVQLVCAGTPYRKLKKQARWSFAHHTLGQEKSLPRAHLDDPDGGGIPRPAVIQRGYHLAARVDISIHTRRNSAMSESPAQIVVSVFQSEDSADQALKQIVEAKRERLVKIQGAAVIRCDAAGKLHISERGDLSAGQGAGSGAAIGAAIGLFGGPLAALLGGSIGGAIGAIAGRLIDTGLPDARLKQIGAALKPGTSALVALIEHTWVGELQTELDRLGGDMLAQAVTSDITRQLEAGKEVAYSALAAAGGTITTRTTTGADGVSIVGIATDGTSLVAGAATLTVTAAGEAPPTDAPPADLAAGEAPPAAAPPANPAPGDAAS